MTGEDLSTSVVRDDPENDRFIIEQDGSVAQLIYEIDGDRLVVVHTRVPDSLGGRGLGGVLVRAAVDRGSKGRLTVVPRCPFARKWLTDHADVAATVNIDWESTPPG
jgi:uncharacterized protein